MTSPESGRLGAWRQSVFWRVAGVLLLAQLIAVGVAAALMVRSAADGAYELAAEKVRLRLDAVAEELELRTDWDAGGLSNLAVPLLADLSARFPDPLTIVDALGQPLLVARPNGEVDGPEAAEGLPSDLAASLVLGVIVTSRDNGWMVAPVYDDVGFLSGGVVIQPLDASLNLELAPARTALVRALATSGLVVLVLALLLASVFTLGLVRPLRAMTRLVGAIGQGDYARRLDATRQDELGHLAGSINEMAAQVRESIDQLQATDRIRRELVANVGHDLRTPLASFLGRVEEADRMLREGRVQEAEEYLENARKQAHYLKALVDDLFELSVLDSPRPRLRIEPIPIAEIVQDACDQFRADLKLRGVGLAVDVAPGIPLVEGDGVRLLRLLGNLLSNAARHTPDGGVISVEAQRVDEGVRVRVTDTGPGLAEETMANLFERYYRGTDARTRQGGGTGLGLAISKAVAAAHGGDLAAANRPIGGAVFTLTLPFRPPALK